MNEMPSVAEATPAVEDPSRPFVHRWAQLVSVTNWEKGHIIFEWRSALEASGAPVTLYSDEAWAERVGNVTGQHVGRLRRTYERFGQVQSEYPGLFWSHFQVALDWDDAEMWLEGAVQNGWSISQMRAKRAETLGGGDASTLDDTSHAEIDEDGTSLASQIAPVAGEVRSVSDADDSERESIDSEAEESPFDTSTGDQGESAGTQGATPKAARVRPFANLPPMPDDVSEAFEQFKLAILTHKMMGWSEFSRDDMLACLGALESLAMQPPEE